MRYEIDLDIFQGPLELLYNLIKKKEIKITKVSLAEITEQYLTYLHKFKEFDLDVASEFMVIASELLELKTRQLLPGSNEDEKEKNENKINLIDRLKIYKRYKNLAYKLSEKEKEARKVFTRQIDIRNKFEIKYKIVIQEDVYEFAEIYKKVVQSKTEDVKKENKKMQIDLTYINEESINVKEKIEEINEFIEYKPDGVEFKQLINDQNNYLEIIVALLAVLELIQLNKLTFKQDRLFSKILLYKAKEKVLS